MCLSLLERERQKKRKKQKERRQVLTCVKTYSKTKKKSALIQFSLLKHYLALLSMIVLEQLKMLIREHEKQ